MSAIIGSDDCGVKFSRIGLARRKNVELGSPLKVIAPRCSPRSLTCLTTTFFPLTASFRRVFAGQSSRRTFCDSRWPPRVLAITKKSKQEPQRSVDAEDRGYLTEEQEPFLLAHRSTSKMATLVATSPPPLNIDSVFAQGHAPPSPAYSSPPRPASPLSPRFKDEHPKSLSDHPDSLHGPSISSSAPNGALTERNDAFMSSVLRGDEPAPVQRAKDMEEFKRRLPPPVEFIEGSSSGAFAASLEGRYEPINASPKAVPKTLIEVSDSSTYDPRCLLPSFILFYYGLRLGCVSASVNLTLSFSTLAFYSYRFVFRCQLSTLGISCN